ncbi:SMP-30/gluconolactonase/LRE family protein, partial [Novosphingobium resinovorum]
MIPQVACKLGAMLGEGPVWDAARGCLWFVDIKGHKLHRFDPASGTLNTVKAPEEPGWVIPLAGAALLVGAKAGVHRFEEDAFA